MGSKSTTVDSNVSVTLDMFDESLSKEPLNVDPHHLEFTFHRFSLLREKNILTDAVIVSSDGVR